MKVLMFMGGNEEGGLEKHFVELANGLAEFCEMVVIGHAKYAPRFLSKVRFHPLDLSLSRRNPLMLLHLARMIRQEKPDVIHAQASKAASILATLRRWVPGKKIATIHNLKKPRSFYNHFDGCICVSRNAGKHLGVANYSVIYNGVDRPFAPPTPTFDGRPRVLAVGRLVEAKGFDILIEAWREIDADLWIAGEGPLFDALQDQIRSLGLEHNIRLLGHRNDIQNLMEQCQLVVISSRWEGFSYVFAESLLTNRAVISTDVPVPNEVLDASLLVDRDDPDGLAAMVQGALENLEDFYQRYQPYFAFAREHFTREQMVDRTYALYCELAAEDG